MKPCTFLRDYTDQERTAYDSLVADSIAQLPFTLAFPISRAAEQISAGNYGRAMNHTLDFLEISVQYLSCLLFVRLQRHEADMAQADRALNRIVTKIDTKRPLSFGDWVNDIFTPLVRTAAAEIPGDPLAATSCGGAATCFWATGASRASCRYATSTRGTAPPSPKTYTAEWSTRSSRAYC